MGGRVDVTVGSALDLFGGSLMKYKDCVSWNIHNQGRAVTEHVLMEILSIDFAIFVIKLSLVIIPVAIAFRLFVLSSEKKEDLKMFIAGKLLGDEQLIKMKVFNIWLHGIATTMLLLGIIIATVLLLI